LKFSIIVCAYNEERVIKKCLQSLVDLNYNSKNFEVLIINDGSIDNTESVVNNFINHHSSIDFRYLHIEHAGLSVARNAGIDQSKYDKILFIDADAIVKNDILVEYQKTYQNPSIDFSGGKINLLNEKSFIANFFQKTRFKQIFEEGRYKEQLIGANMSFKKKLFIQDGGFPDIFISRGDDTYIRERFITKYKYQPTPRAIVLHERPTNFFDCLNIFYIESVNGEKLKRILKPNQMKNNILSLSLGFISIFISLYNFKFIFILFIMYLFKSLYNSYINVKSDDNKNIIIYMFGYTLLKIIERIIKIFVFIKNLPMKTPEINRDLKNYNLIR
tara:strand:+ start:648 stop:1640 length:993 start_codon:yes stop_codon:yes gene_type:complete